jgi:hypothetical protein
LLGRNGETEFTQQARKEGEIRKEIVFQSERRETRDEKLCLVSRLAFHLIQIVLIF